MSAWTSVTLGDVCEFKYGKSLPASAREPGPFPVYGSNGQVATHTRALTNGPTIVIGRKGSLGEVHRSEEACWPIDTTYYIDETATDADLTWLTYRLRGLGLTELNRAAAIPGLNREDAYRRSLLLPPLDEQRRIAAILDHADGLRAKRRQVLAHLDALPQAIFHEMFSGGGFPMISGADAMPHIRNGVSPSTKGEVEAEVLTLNAVTRGRFDPNAAKTAKFGVTPGPDKRVRRADFLMCRGNGNRSLVGIGVVPDADDPALVFPDTVIAGEIDTQVVQPSYLATAWGQRDVRDQIEAGARTTNGTHKINQQVISAVQFPLPPQTLQSEFGTRVAAIADLRFKLAAQLAADDALFASLQARAFRGELR